MHTHQAHLIQADIKHIYQSERIFENIPALCLMFAKSCACCVYILSDMHLHKFEHWTFPKRYRTSLYDTMTFLRFNLKFDNPYYCFLLIIPPCVNNRLQSSQRWKKNQKIITLRCRWSKNFFNHCKTHTLRNFQSQCH